MKKYFNNCNTIEELKKMYRHLAKINHPDAGGSHEAMTSINNQYDIHFEKLRNIHNSKEENANNQNNECPESFRNIINTLIVYPDITIEVCGSWLWVYGLGTYACKDTLKELNFKWAKSKKAWYLGEINKKSRRSTPMQEIRQKYGSEMFRSQQRLCLA